ncbi:hypothetical protein GALMADRAFT_91189 [Galerina marginata CBS 339.88]|uniref:CCZ1/INTU/HSP4 first Longin domain-containing protein n=1 Tax=Galerina marginata (strain CBS 339.88) TaxID=685588 RepID=A0A067TBY9_GALM3|nr:hypothetical protein GALMADRAFT_91189 [Galerina marginata CBS 339.88]
MNRIPPNLSYLTIYNPTLHPTGPVDGDSEDAEEQAHILFYTSKERAVSRDRMLRQIGLAKALINFAELFNPEDSCDNVHSQSKRMIMVSPEPDFWIHAGVEVAKVPRAADPKSNAKTKGKPTTKGKEKEKETGPIYDYEEGSVHDSALRAHILKGYERFKLTHGSFTSILSSLGQQALELQLERFWTVWAWSWDLEEKIEFGEQLGEHNWHFTEITFLTSPGPLLHPCFSPLIPIIDEFSDKLSSESTPVVLSRQHIIPSGRYSEGRYPAALASHLSSMIPPPVAPSRSSDTLNTLASSVDTIKGKRIPDSSANGAPSNPRAEDGAGVNFLGIPAMNVNMDMKKWNWPGYLTFGKGSTVKPPLDKSTIPQPEKEKQHATTPTTSKDLELSRVEVEVNADALEDAISSDSLSLAPNVGDGSLNGDSKPTTDLPGPDQLNLSDGIDHPITNDISLESNSTALSLAVSNLPDDSPPPSPPPLPEFSMTRLHLAPFQDGTSTRRVTIHYLIRGELMLALINTQGRANGNQQEDDADLHIAAERVIKLFDDLESAIYDAGLKSVSDSLPSATKILQTQDRYLISTGQYTHSSPGFSSTSSHLFNAKAILDIDPKITEVFSRGQNPQHWHIAKRGLASSQSAENENAGSDEAVFMEVFRKETSLTDVDNVLAGVVKKSGLLDGASSLGLGCR